MFSECCCRLYFKDNRKHESMCFGKTIDLSTARPKWHLDGPVLLGHLLFSLVMPMQIAITITIT